MAMKRIRAKPINRGRRQAEIRKIAEQVVKKQTVNKFYDSALAVNFADTGVATDLSDMSQGDTSSERQGNQVVPVSLDIRGTMLTSSSGSWNVATCTMIVLQWDVDSASDAPTGAKVLQQVEPYSFLNRDRVGDFRVLKRKFFTLNPLTSSGAHSPQCFKDITMHIPLSKAKRIRYNSGATSGDNHIYLLCLSNVASYEPDFYGTARLNYHD